MSWNAFFFHHEPNTCLQKVMELRSTHIFFRAILLAQIHDCVSHYVRATYATKIFIALQKPVVRSRLFYKFIFVFVFIVYAKQYHHKKKNGSEELKKLTR